MSQQQQKIDVNPVKKSLSISQTDGRNSKLSLVIALNRLKETQDHVYQARKRLQIMKMRQTSFDQRNFQKSRCNQYHQQIRSFMDSQKKNKNDYLMRRSFQIKKSKDKSLQFRNKHKQKLDELKQSMNEAHKQNYEESRRQRQQHKEAIQKARRGNNEEKRRNCQKLYEESKSRKNYMKQYLRNKELNSKLRKQVDILTVQSRINQGQRIIENLQRAEFDTSRYNINPQSNADMSEKDSESKKGEKGFRVKYYKNQTTVLLE